MKCKSEWGRNHRIIYKLNCEYCGKEYESLGVKDCKYCCHDCYIRDRFWREEGANEIVKMVLENKKAACIPKWLKDLFLSNTEE